MKVGNVLLAPETRKPMGIEVEWTLTGVFGAGQIRQAILNGAVLH